MFLFFNKINKLGLWVGVGWSEVVRGARGRSIAYFCLHFTFNPIKGMLLAFVAAFLP